MYFNCPNHPPNYRKFRNLYIRRVGFQYQKPDFNPSKTTGTYSEKEFYAFIDEIHDRTGQFIVFYKILTMAYIFSWLIFILMLFSKLAIAKFYCVFPFISAGVTAFGLIKSKDHYLKMMNDIINEENRKIIKRNNVKWILGHSANFIQLNYIEDDKIPLNL